MNENNETTLNQSSIPSVLFVDDEVKVLDALKRMMRSMKNKWSVYFAASGREGLNILAENPCNVVISDMKMPEMDGGEFLRQVKDRFPATIRFILSGHADKELILKTIGPTHRFFTKPCSIDMLVSAVSEALATHAAMKKYSRIENAVAGISELPAMPELYIQIQNLFSSPYISLEKAAMIIGQDIGMTAEILHVVNSSFFRLSHQISDITDALNYLGTETVKGIIISANVFNKLPDDTIELFNLKELQRHSIKTAALSGVIAKSMMLGNKSIIDKAITTGLLHDVGKLILISNMKDIYKKIYLKHKDAGIPLHIIEQQELGTTHAEIGGYLTELWGLPQPIVNAISCHHAPARSIDDSFSMLTAVHTADVIEHEQAGVSTKNILPEIDYEYLARIGVKNSLNEWRELAKLI